MNDCFIDNPSQDTLLYCSSAAPFYCDKSLVSYTEMHRWTGRSCIVVSSRSISFSSPAVQLLDVANLALVEHFAASLEPEAASFESVTHPSRLFELLGQTAQLYIGSNTSFLADPSFIDSLPDPLKYFDLVPFGMGEAETAATGNLGVDSSQAYDLSDWHYGNQQIMSLLDEDVVLY